MTRFLSRLLDDPQCGGLNEETERLFAYHQATKHNYYSVRTSAHYLDWNNQPDPFRNYEGAFEIALPPDPGFPETGTFDAMEALVARTSMVNENKSDDRGRVHLNTVWLSRLLWHSVAISAWKKAPRSGSRYALRVNPSSGNLHPTETHLALRGFAGLDDGLYHYRADRHAIELRSPGAWTQHLAQALLIPCAAESPLIVGLTSIFWREAWKYRDRAYRYCCHDLGHAMMSLLLGARALGLPGGAIAHFADSRMTRVLGLMGSDEAPMAFLVFPPKNFAGRTAAVPRETFVGIPNELSTEEKPYELLLEMHRATILPDIASPVLLMPELSATVLPELSSEHPARDSGMAAVVRRRRSALDFDARTPPMERSDTEQLLDFATRDWPADWRGNFSGQMSAVGRGADFVTLYLYVHRVRGCESGVYRWNASSRTLEQLHRGNVERVAAFLSLEQALAGNACFAVSMIANLAKAARLFGNRGYRYVHFEAGAIGQRLYVGAEALGWNATGIGAFYDDDVHRYLGFLAETDGSVVNAVDTAERAALVMLGSPSSLPPTQEPERSDQDPKCSDEQDLDRREQDLALSESSSEAAPLGDSSKLPRQVIYHFAVGRAITDPRLEV